MFLKRFMEKNLETALFQEAIFAKNFFVFIWRLN